MNITNAKLVVPNPPGLKIFENFGLDIICTHETPNTHATTKLWRRKNGKLILIKTDNPNGLEDAHEIRRGNDRLMVCEIKTDGGEQFSSGIFKSTDGINYIQTDTLKPTTGWQKDSVSSPTFYDNGLPTVPMLYEGRYRENWDDFKTGIAYVNFKTGKIVSRQSNPILNDRLVPDDIWRKNDWYWYSFHTREDINNKSVWFAKLYKSRGFGRGLIFDSNIIWNGEPIIAYYKDKSFYWKNFKGMWQEIKETNGGNMQKPKTELVGNTLKVVNPIAGVKYQWNYSKIPNGFTSWLDSGDTYDIPSGKQKDGYEFWAYPNNETSNMSDRVVYGSTIEPPIEPPTDNTKALNHIRAARAELNKAEEELMK